MSSINFKTTYPLSHQYDAIKSRAPEILGDFLSYDSIYCFNDQDKTTTFNSERLIPEKGSGRQRVLLLFSNPHPHAIQLGMFLSPSVKGGQSLFWTGMQDAGWFRLPEENPCPKCLAEIFLKLEYESRFEFLFYCFYSFPTRYPEHLVKLFGRDYFKEVIAPEASERFSKIIQEEKPEVVVTFNKGVFNLVSTEPVEKYIHRLKEGEVIQSNISGVEREILIYLSYPTGWRYDKDNMMYRRNSLEKIRDRVLRGSSSIEV